MLKFFVSFASLLCALTLLSFPQTGLADEKTDQEIQKLNVPDYGSSVYELHFWTEVATILAGTAISVGAQAYQYQLVNKSCPCDANGVNFIDRSDTDNDNHTLDVIANWTVTGALALPIIFDYFDVGLSKAFVEDMVVYLDVLSVNFGLVTLAKFGFQRPYPYMYKKTGQGFDSEPLDYMSFYSGHTSTTISALAFASATLNLRHKKVLWPWILTGLLGASVATELVMSAEHFKSDVIVGAAMGLAIGTIVPGLHARNENWYDRIFMVSDQDGMKLLLNFPL